MALPASQLKGDLQYFSKKDEEEHKVEEEKMQVMSKKMYNCLTEMSRFDQYTSRLNLV